MSTAGDSKEDCALGEECGVHYRISSRHQEGGWFLNYTDYIGEYMVITSVRVGSMLAVMLAEKISMHPYDTAVLKVGDMTLHEKAIEAYDMLQDDDSWTAWTQTYKNFDQAASGHDMVVQALKNEMLDLKV